jgi:hypothetical protein
MKYSNLQWLLTGVIIPFLLFGLSKCEKQSSPPTSTKTVQESPKAQKQTEQKFEFNNHGSGTQINPVNIENK